MRHTHMLHFWSGNRISMFSLLISVNKFLAKYVKERERGSIKLTCARKRCEESSIPSTEAIGLPFSVLIVDVHRQYQVLR